MRTRGRPIPGSPLLLRMGDQTVHTDRRCPRARDATELWSAAALKNAATDEDQTRHHTSCPPIFGAKKVREKVCFANRATDLPNSVLSRSLNY